MSSVAIVFYDQYGNRSVPIIYYDTGQLAHDLLYGDLQRDFLDCDSYFVYKVEDETTTFPQGYDTRHEI